MGQGGGDDEGPNQAKEMKDGEEGIRVSRVSR
jgi:hypothetical protein